MLDVMGQITTDPSLKIPSERRSRPYAAQNCPAPCRAARES